MSKAEYEENFPGKETYETERKLEQFKFTEEGLAEGLFWIRSLKEKAETDGKAWEYSFATVCYEMKDGRQRYRVYPVDEVDLQSFSRVFETKEYKENAYPALLWENVGDNRFAWKDGVCNQILKLTKEEKEVFLKLYKVSDGKLMETQTANYFSDIYPIDCAVLSANAQSCQKCCTLLSVLFCA